MTDQHSDDRVARAALSFLAEPGDQALWEMVQAGGAEQALQRLLHDDIADPALRRSVNAALTAGGDPRPHAEVTLGLAERGGARLVVPADQEWPERIGDLARLASDLPGRRDRHLMPPLGLWVRGDWPLGEVLRRSVAVVGARAATPYGVHVASQMAAGLAGRGWTVVTGGAFGVDAAANRATLATGGCTVVVLACGVDRPHPAANALLFAQIAETGLLISEWPPRAEPLRHRFLARNRTIAAVTAGTVLIEAAAGSGSLQMMCRALQLRRPAMVVPGPVTSAMSTGGHELLREHPESTLVTGPSQVLDVLGDPAPAAAPRHHDPAALDHESARILAAVPAQGTITPESLAEVSGLDLRIVLRRLTLLEGSDHITRRDDGIARPPGQPRH
ncbi:DNA-processing protein DprA [Actinoplanes sp. NPDC000266]